MHGQADVFEIGDDLVVHIDGEVCRLIRVSITGSDFRIDEQTQMWVVDLNDRDAFGSQ